MKWHSLLTLSFLLAVLPPLGWAQENKITETLNGITFNANYDNGSLASIEAGDDDTYRAEIFTENGELGTRRYWFRFSMRGVAGRTVRLIIDHEENPRPFIRLGLGPWRRTTVTEAPDRNTLTFTFNENENEAEVAFFEPMGYAETLTETEALAEPSPHAATRVLGKSHLGFDLPITEVTDESIPSNQKHRVWVHSRAHAGEVTSTHSFLGFLERVVEDSPAGRTLRRYCHFHLVPLLNIDGVILGHTRWDSTGHDPEREWCDVTLPEVQLIKNEVDRLMADPRPIELSLNLHSTKGVYTDTFFFKHLVPSVSRNFEIIQQNYIDALNEASQLFDNRSPGASQLHPCRFIESYFWNGWGESVMALTHEGHFYRRLTDGDWITGADYRQLGRDLATALIQYFELPLDEIAYEDWKDVHFNQFEQVLTSVSGPLADPDSDGYSNLLEYALGLDPRRTETVPAVTATTDEEDRTHLNFERPLNRTDLRLGLEYSEDLENWTFREFSHPDLEATRSARSAGNSKPFSACGSCELAVTQSTLSSSSNSPTASRC
ncbi:MAG: M14 family zinc carboxypeptidase, partial [Verrucomicrobiota bacterium]